MFTAIVVGGVLACAAILTFSFFFHAKADTLDLPIAQQSEEDPTYSSRFTNSVIYSAEQNQEIIESTIKSLPKTSIKNVTAKEYIVHNIDDDSIIIQNNNEVVKPIASVTKLITAVMARKLLDQDSYIIITQKILNVYGNEGHLRLGEKLKVSELMYPLLLVSSNDTAEALASSYSGGRQKFIREMNDWVNSIGAYKTYFRDASGLSPDNVSSANDLIIITKWILKNDPEIFDITLNKDKTIRTHTWTNPTHFLNLSTYVGGKNGYTPEANRTSVSLFKIGKQKKLFAVVLLGSASRDNDTLDLLDEAVK